MTVRTAGTIAAEVAILAALTTLTAPRANALPVQDPGPSQTVPTPRASFAIRAADGKVLFTPDQIRSYDWKTHILTLTPKVREELAARLLKSRRLVSGVPFV